LNYCPTISQFFHRALLSFINEPNVIFAGARMLEVAHQNILFFRYLLSIVHLPLSIPQLCSEYLPSCSFAAFFVAVTSWPKTPSPSKIAAASTVPPWSFHPPFMAMGWSLSHRANARERSTK
jgi:hypothetical protein